MAFVHARMTHHRQTVVPTDSHEKATLFRREPNGRTNSHPFFCDAAMKTSRSEFRRRFSESFTGTSPELIASELNDALLATVHSLAVQCRP